MHALDELVLRRAALDDLLPLVQPPAQLAQVAADVLEHTEVHERGRFGTSARAPRSSRARPTTSTSGGASAAARAGSGDPDTRRITGVDRAVVVREADVVRRVPRCGEALEPDGLVADDPDVRLRHGSELAPELVEGVAVEPARAGLEP